MPLALLICPPRSLSARRAWIEIRMGLFPAPATTVALRKESVDRNYIIKITGKPPRVALRKESVDRNSDGVVSGSGDYGRSPQGERG